MARQEILKKLGLKSGGGISEVLDELVLCDFIERYAPYNLDQSGKSLVYSLHDNYLRFFYRFVEPKLEDIQSGNFAGRAE